MDGMTIDANAIFDEELSRRGFSFVMEDRDTYRVHLEGGEITVNLANVRRNAERDQDAAAIGRFVDKVLETFPSLRPAWDEASALLLWAAEPADQDFGGSIRVAVTNEVTRVLTLTDAGQTKITWVTPDMCETWGVTIEQAIAAAFVNQDRLLDGIALDVTEANGNALGMVLLDSPYKASVIFAKAFKRLVEPVLGWPVLAVVPCRDFIYVVADDSPLVSQMGSVVVNEFRNSGYPITTEVLRLSEEGIEAIGHFPT
jgi:hypothetical protein